MMSNKIGILAQSGGQYLGVTNATKDTGYGCIVIQPEHKYTSNSIKHRALSES